MQSSSRSRSFKSGLIGARPITDAIFCPRSSVRSERHRARVEVAGAIPAVDAILPLCLSSYRASFVNSYSSVQVRPEAPFYGDHDVTAASRPVTAFVLVRIRLVTPISMGRSCCGIDADTNCHSTFQFGVLVLPRSTCPCRYGGFVQT